MAPGYVFVFPRAFHSSVEVFHCLFGESGVEKEDLWFMSFVADVA